MSKKDKLCPDCGKLIWRKSTKCRSCVMKGHKRNVGRKQPIEEKLKRSKILKDRYATIEHHWKGCHHSRASKKKIGLGVSGEKNSNYKHGVSESRVMRLSRLLIDLSKSKCGVCGSKKFLGIHHKNRNRGDNSIENLQVLCRSCHAKHHYYADHRVGKDGKFLKEERK